MSKPGKRIAVAAGVLVVAVVVAVAVVFGQLGRIIKRGVETVGPTVTGTPVTLSSAMVSIFSGEGALRGLHIGNPQGFTTPTAFELGKVGIAVDPASLAGDVIRIRSIVVEAPRLVAEFDAAGVSNLKAILDHAKSTARKTPASDEPADGAQQKMIIEEFRFVDAEVRALAPAYKLDKTLKLPPIVLKQLGAKEGGAAAADIAEQILRPVVNAAVKTALDEYVKAKRGELEEKAKERLRDKLFGK